MLATLCVSLLSLAGQNATPIPPSPFDRVIELALSPDDPPLEGRGSARWVEHEIEFEGTLHVWTRAAFDSFLRVEGGDGVLLAENDESGGRPTPYLALEVEPAMHLRIAVAAVSPELSGAIALHLVACPESDVTRAAAMLTIEMLTEVEGLRSAGELDRARELLAESLSELLTVRGVKHSREVEGALWKLGFPARELGALETAKRAWGGVWDRRKRRLPEDHHDLLAARLNLAVLLYSLGDVPGARGFFERVVSSYERTLPEDHLDLLRARQNLALTMKQMGDLPGARALEVRVLEGLERTLHEDHRSLLAARQNLAVTMSQMGDLSGARALFERVLDAFERTLSEDHADLLSVRGNLASTLRALGDFLGARALEERALEARERTLPESHADLLAARSNLASTLREMGDLEGAATLKERVLDGFECTLPEDHRSLLAARANLAVTLKELGDLSGARALEERVLEGFNRTLHEEHPDLLRARTNFAVTLYLMGDLAGARALQERALQAQERRLPRDHPDLLTARLNLAVTLREMGDLEAVRPLVPALVSGMLMRAVSALALSPRETREVVGADVDMLAAALFLSEPGNSKTRDLIFDLVETRRLAATESARGASLVARDPGLAPLVREAAGARAELNDLVTGAAREGLSGTELGAELEHLSGRRDRAERAMRAALAERGVVAKPISNGTLAAVLPEGSAAIGFLRYVRLRANADTNRIENGKHHLLAHVLSPEGTLARVDLGPAAELERLVADWRDALGAPLRRETAMKTRPGEEEVELDRGGALREQLLDPLLVAAGEEARTLFVCPDDLVFLVPLDALPTSSGRVGDDRQVIALSSFGSLLAPGASMPSAETLLLLANPSFDTEGLASDSLALASPPLEAGSRGGMPERFDPLSQTELELESLQSLFERAFERGALVLSGENATKAALAERASGARYLHLATHGWFAPESVKSILDPAPGERGEWQRLDLEQRISGFAPMTLCGLALAGANRGRDSLGRVPGILTAEELCTFDLSNCELAVLSACETNVGLRRAGQGIQSLQAALHSAGARTAITSLWKVDDEATRKLMELFYSYLWIEKLPKAEALWKAKCALRAKRRPPREWAGWVLSGDPG